LRFERVQRALRVPGSLELGLALGPSSSFAVTLPVLDVLQGVGFEESLDLPLELVVGEFAVRVALPQPCQRLVVPVRVGASGPCVGRFVGRLASRRSAGDVLADPLLDVVFVAEQDGSEGDQHDVSEQHEREPPLEPQEERGQPDTGHEHRDDARRVLAGPLGRTGVLHTSGYRQPSLNGCVGVERSEAVRADWKPFSFALAKRVPMNEFGREQAIDRVAEIVSTVASEPMPVPVREVWVYGDVALGLDPVERLDVYLTKDILMRDAPERAEEFEAELGVQGVGKTVRAAWADENPEYVRANSNGHAAPEQCLAAQLLDDDEPVHLEVCNASFEDNVRQRLKGAQARENYEQILDPRGVCLWVDDDSGGQRSDEAFRKLREGELVFPTLSGALEMLGMEADEASDAADVVEAYRERQDGATVRGDVV